jgi:glycosyltransferase involved in cell wall biosynthesis
MRGRRSGKFVRGLVAEHGVHLCPSLREGFGHYINEARAASAVVVTTDYGPMNEYVQDGNTAERLAELRPNT